MTSGARLGPAPHKRSTPSDLIQKPQGSDLGLCAVPVARGGGLELLVGVLSGPRWCYQVQPEEVICLIRRGSV